MIKENHILLPHVFGTLILFYTNLAWIFLLVRKIKSSTNVTTTIVPRGTIVQWREQILVSMFKDEKLYSSQLRVLYRKG